MAARLARLPLRARAREIAAVLMIGAFLGGLGSLAWLYAPTSKPSEHFEGRVLRFWSTPAGRTRPSHFMVDVELPDHRELAVYAPDWVPNRCKVSDNIRLTGSRTNGGWLSVSVDSEACRKARTGS